MISEEMVGLFKCRNCGATFGEGKVDVPGSVSWAVKDMADVGDTTSAFSKTSLPERFIIHWCNCESLGICDLIGFKTEVHSDDK